MSTSDRPTQKETEMKNETTETRQTADQNEMKYFNTVYFTDAIYGKSLIAAVRYISDAIALANAAEYACDGTIEVADVFGKIVHTREIKH